MCEKTVEQLQAEIKQVKADCETKIKEANLKVKQMRSACVTYICFAAGVAITTILLRRN